MFLAEADLKGGLWTQNKCDSCCFRGTTKDEKMQIMSTCLDKLFIYKDKQRMKICGVQIVARASHFFGSHRQTGLH